MITDLCFLIPVNNAHIFNPTAELVKPTRIPTSEANAEIDTDTVTDSRSENKEMLKVFSIPTHFLINFVQIIMFYFF